MVKSEKEKEKRDTKCEKNGQYIILQRSYTTTYQQIFYKKQLFGPADKLIKKWNAN